MIELTVDWQKIIKLDDIPNRDADGDDTGASDPLRSEYGNLYGFCDDPRLGNRIVVVKNYTPFCGRPRPAVERFVCVSCGPSWLDLENDELSGQTLSINGTSFVGRMVATNQNPFRQWALVKPDENGNIPTVDLKSLQAAMWVAQISNELGVPLRGV